MRKLLALAFLVAVVVCIAAFGKVSASGGTFLPAGSYGVELQTTPSPTIVYFTSFPGPPKTIVCNNVTYTWDAESECYKAPSPNGDNWTFDGVGHATFEDWPPFPQLGPAVTIPGLVF